MEMKTEIKIKTRAGPAREGTIFHRKTFFHGKSPKKYFSTKNFFFAKNVFFGEENFFVEKFSRENFFPVFAIFCLGIFSGPGKNTRQKRSGGDFSDFAEIFRRKILAGLF